jgi:hypothetical protein
MMMKPQHDGGHRSFKKGGATGLTPPPQPTQTETSQENVKERET